VATTICFCVQKGGVGKTTTSAITAHLLAKESRVLAVDFDSQGNLTQFLTQRNIYDFEGRTALEACKEKDPRPYIYHISDNLHILPAEDFLSLLARYLYDEYRGNKSLLLKETLAVVKDDYDYIIVDLPPNLGEQTVNGLAASDYAVIMLQSEPFCYDAVDRFVEFLIEIQKNANPDLRLAGILTSMLDTRASLDNGILDRARSTYGDIVFNTTIKRRTRLKEFSVSGVIESTKADREALEQYYQFVEELKQRVQS
jgi:chromosome partitioning protein